MPGAAISGRSSGCPSRGRFTVCLIPHTLEITTLGALRPGDQVNLEVDLVARYLERLADPFNEEMTTAEAGRESGE